MKVLIVDDDQMLCESLKFILVSNGIDVVGTANNGHEALRFCQQFQVDVILMDIRMPLCDGVIGTRLIKAAFPKINIIMLTTFDDENYIAQALKNGASAYLLKTVKPEKIIETLNIIHDGNIVLHSSVANKVRNLISEDTELDLSDYNLTDNHKAIMQLIAQGFRNKEIANELHLSEGTIRNRISDILLELNLRDRTQIAIFWHTGGKMTFHNS